MLLQFSRTFSRVDLEGLAYLVFSSSSGSTLFPLPLLAGSLSPEGRDLMEASHLGLNVVPRSITLCIISSCRPLYLSSSIKEDASLMVAEEGADI